MCHLCRECKSIQFDYHSTANDEIKLPLRITDSLPSLPYLRSSAQNGCEICRLFAYQINRIWGKRIEGQGEKCAGAVIIDDAKLFLENGNLNGGYKLPEEQNGAFKLVVRIKLEGIGMERVGFKVYADEGGEAAIQGRIQRRLPGLIALSDKNVEMIHRWTEQCLKTHEPCRRKEMQPLPTRVLDVSFSDLSDPVRLYEPKKVTVDNYIALSHCWGVPTPSSPHFKTESHTLEARFRGISLQEMPQNFVDAVLVARKLGVKYVWIDSLCIIQDSAEDWAREAAKMHQVYRNSLLTVVATSASSTYDGFLQRTRTCTPARIPYADGRDMISVVPETIHYLDSYFDRYVEDATWNHRGWTFQERLLSRRLLHFSTSMLIFECRVGTYSEDNTPAPSHVNRTPWLEKFNQGAYLPLSKDDQMLLQWYLLIEKYTIRLFTQNADKLPALSGLAHELHDATPDEYLAGIWRRDLLWGLLWNTYAYDTVTIRESPSYRAPSWSWARIDGSIWNNRSADGMRSNSNGPATPMMEIVETYIEPEGSDTMGRVTAGWIKALARVRRISAVLLTSENIDMRSTHCHDVILDGTKVGEGHLDLEHTSVSANNLFAMPVLDIKEGLGHEPRGLLLEEEQSGVYRRIGSFVFYTPGKKVFGAQTDFFDDCVPELVTLI